MRSEQPTLPECVIQQSIVQSYLNEGYSYVIELDLEKFLDKVNHDKLMSLLSFRLSDKVLLKLIRRYLRTGILENSLCHPREEGTPQGSPLSPILSNLLFDELDKELERLGFQSLLTCYKLVMFNKSPRAERHAWWCERSEKPLALDKKSFISATCQKRAVFPAAFLC
nr:reverse transcriptase domain-containing protein [uncultured Bacteroides sp.]